MSDKSMISEKELFLVELNKFDSYEDIVRYYDLILSIYENDMKGQKTTLSEDDVKLLASPIPYSRIMASSAMMTIGHLFEKIPNIDDAAQQEAILFSLPSECREVFRYFYKTANDKSISGVDNKDLTKNLRDKSLHAGSTLSYEVSEETKDKAFSLTKKSKDKRLSQEEVAAIEAEFKQLQTDIESNLDLNQIFVNYTQKNFSGIVEVSQLVGFAKALSDHMSQFEDYRVIDVENQCIKILDNSEEDSEPKKVIPFTEKEKRFIDRYIKHIGQEKWESAPEEARQNCLIRMIEFVNSSTMYNIGVGGVKSHNAEDSSAREENRENLIGSFMPIAPSYFAGIYLFAQNIQNGNSPDLEINDDTSKKYQVGLEDLFGHMYDSNKNDYLAQVSIDTGMMSRDITYFQILLSAASYELGYIKEELLAGNNDRYGFRAKYLESSNNHIFEKVLGVAPGTSIQDSEKDNIIEATRNSLAHGRTTIDLASCLDEQGDFDINAAKLTFKDMDERVVLTTMGSTNIYESNFNQTMSVADFIQYKNNIRDVVRSTGVIPQSIQFNPKKKEIFKLKDDLEPASSQPGRTFINKMNVLKSTGRINADKITRTTFQSVLDELREDRQRTDAGREGADGNDRT